MAAVIKKNLKKVISIFGIKISKDFKISPLFKRNVFKTNFKKRVLISYIVEPFIKQNNFSHSNFQECYTAAEIFNELGFCVDVIDCFIDKKINYANYDVVYGMGIALEKSFNFTGKKIKRIFYATGCNPVYSNIETLVKVRNFQAAHGRTLLSSSRFISHGFYLQTILSDCVLILGNDFVLNTYSKYDIYGEERYKKLNCFFYDVHDIDLSKKDFLRAKKHFLWFGSSGLLHKGLDILIDIFSKRSDIFLHICGASKNEQGFFDYYKPILSKSKNIVNHGFVDIKSQFFKDIMNQCAFIIYPSVSEGGSPAILNVIANGGLIPIITKSSGLDFNGFGIIIERPELKLVNSSIDKALLLDEKQLFNLAVLAKNDIRTNYTYNKYRKNLHNLIKDIIFR